MTYSLAQGISFGMIGSDAVVLDLTADRYLRLTGARVETLEHLARSNTVRSCGTADGLVAAGILTRDRGEPVLPIEAPVVVTSILERSLYAEAAQHSSQVSIEKLPAFEVISARVIAGSWMRIAGLSGTVDRWRDLRSRLAPGRVDAAAAATKISQDYAVARSLLPVQRRCVPDSLALIGCLWRRGITAELFFGVRLTPFAAHAWVQTGTLLLSDPLDSVAEFTPVFRL